MIKPTLSLAQCHLTDPQITWLESYSDGISGLLSVCLCLHSGLRVHERLYSVLWKVCPKQLHCHIRQLHTHNKGWYCTLDSSQSTNCNSTSSESAYLMTAGLDDISHWLPVKWTQPLLQLLLCSLFYVWKALICSVCIPPAVPVTLPLVGPVASEQCSISGFCFFFSLAQFGLLLPTPVSSMNVSVSLISSSLSRPRLCVLLPSLRNAFR